MAIYDRASGKEYVKHQLEDVGVKNKQYDTDLDGKVDQIVLHTTDLEYKTEDVPLVYLEILGKTNIVQVSTYGRALVTKDSFADKGITHWQGYGNGKIYTIGRHVDWDMTYISRINPDKSAADHEIVKIDNNTFYTIASEAVDLNMGHLIHFQITGSTLKSNRDGLSFGVGGVTISATDTRFASGKWGASYGGVNSPSASNVASARLYAPATPLPKSKAIIELEIGDNGEPNLKQELVEVDETQVPIEVWEVIKNNPRGANNLPLVDKAAVTWGAFDHTLDHTTMLVIVTSGNPYTGEDAIQRQIEYARSKGLTLMSPPKDYSEAVEQYNHLKHNFPEWLAGKDNYAYQTIGHEDLEPLAVVDFYYGELVEHKTHYNQLKNIPDWEMERTLNMWKERLERITVLVAERDKHLKKLMEVKKKGW